LEQLFEFHFFVWMIALGAIAMLVWMKYFMMPIYKFLDSVGLIKLDTNKTVMKDWDVIGNKGYAVLNLVIMLLPIIFAIVLPDLLLERIFYSYGVILLILLVILPAIVLELRVDVFNHRKQVLYKGVVIQNIFFDGEHYPLEITWVFSFLNMWFCIFFAIGNYFLSHHYYFLIYMIITFIIEFLILFVDKVDGVLSINLKNSVSYFSYMIILVVLSFGIALVVYPIAI